MAYGMRQGNRGRYLDYGPYQPIECAPQWLEYLLTFGTTVAVIVPETGGDREPVAMEENCFNTSTNRCVPENLRWSQSDTDVGARIC